MTPEITPTPEQQRVIDHPLTPVRVTAGAGTGKTSTIADRLATLVMLHDLDPEQTLGITFTNKAAEELASRLRAALPEHASLGHEVQVQTYHGFANSVLREFGPMIGLPREARIVPGGYARQLLREAIADVSPASLDLTQPGRRVDELARLSSVIGDHLLDPEDLSIESVAADGDDVAEMRADLMRVLAAYARRKRDLGAVDYADMARHAHRLLSDGEISERVRSRYRVVLLDEYQDTNPGQRELLRAVFGGGFPITAVGDPDQTIYEWRGASPANFSDFPSHFPTSDGAPAPTLPLSINWRSDTAVVAVANAVRSHIGDPSGLDSLSARPGAPDGRVRSHWLRTSVDEARWIAAEVHRLHVEEGLKWSDIAILFRKHRQMGLVRDALAGLDVPVEVAALGGLLEVPEVADLHAWLRILGRPDDDIALARLLLGGNQRLGLGELAPLSAWARHKRRLDDDESPVGWALVESLDHLDELADLAPHAAERLSGFSSLYRGLLESAQGATLVELCRLILDRTDAWLEVDALDDAPRLSARLNLYRFLDLAEAWSPLEGAPSLEAFLDYLDLLSDEAADEALDTANVSGEDAVVMLTVHRAKGLEWPVVFLPALAEGVFPSGIHGYEDPARRPEVLPDHLRLDTNYRPPLPDDEDERREALRRRHASQEWRTAYVAVTRARHELIATGAFWYTTGRHRRPSALFTTIDDDAVPESGRSTEPGDAPESLHLIHQTGPAPDPHFADGWKGALTGAIADPTLPQRLAADAGLGDAFQAESERMRITLESLAPPAAIVEEADSFRTTVSAVMTFASCPQRFHWSYADRLPRRASAAARRGTDIHRRIEVHLRGGTPLTEPAAREDQDDVSAEEDREGPLDRFRRSRFAASEPLLVEAPFSLLLDDARIDGRIDAVYEPEPGLWEIVDFKSGRVVDDDTRRVQMEAYALAVSEAGFSRGREPRRIRTTFAYLGDDEIVEVSEDVDDEWLAAARRHLEALATAASDGERSATPSDACRWCDFTRFCAAGRAWLEENT